MKPKQKRAPKQTEDHPRVELRGWKTIADYLGQPLSTTQRWASIGMPVEHSGRNVVADPAALDGWLGRESGHTEPLHIAHSGEDMLSELRKGLEAARRSHSPQLKPTRK